MNKVLRMTSSAAPVASDDVRGQVERILASDAFIRSPRMQRFLRFIVDETLAGREQELGEYGIGVAVFDRGADFEPAVDPIVRNDARRLRFKLLDYYREVDAASELVMIDIPKGGYVPVFARPGLQQTEAARPANAQVRIAVLPFEVWAAVPVTDMGFVGGLSASLTAHLTNLNGLETIAQGFVHRLSLQDAVADLRLSHVLQGSVLRNGDNCRVIVNLIQVSSGTQLWAGEYSFPIDEMFETQARIAHVVCDMAAARLGLSQRPVLMTAA